MNASNRIPQISELKGVGPSAVDVLKQLGVESIEDLFSYFPYRYDNYEIQDLENAGDSDHLTVRGKIQSEPVLSFYAKRRSRLSVRVLSGRNLVTVIAFNRPYLKKKLNLGDEVTVTGKWERARAEITATEFHIGAPDFSEQIAPVYPVKDGMTVRRMRSIVRQVFNQFQDSIVETLPPTLIEEYRLMGRKEAIREIHFPTGRDALKQARRRLVYEEFLIYELKMQCYKQVKRKSGGGTRINIQTDSIRSFIRTLPFPLTRAQERVVKEILADLGSPFAMNRLLQGDVGSGKTIVAAIALYAAVTAGFQGALMAPTEILAEQHADSLQKLFEPFSVSVALLTGNVRGKERRPLLEELKKGHIDILVGTHALIQDDVLFKQLGLVVTDEQHRFGVGQRRLLRVKGKDPDVLYMTATPIPRTLAITVFGDMDVSTIDELPGGRKTIRTYWVRHEMMGRVIRFMEKELRQGRQAYVVCPLIEESEQLDVQNALDMHAELTRSLPDYRIGLMHGKLTNDEKSEVMNGFKEQKIHVLVSTTVVEVGVNVPNATLMIINDADRFGLSQLHQLRGRVGRGNDQSYCILVADARSETSRERMKLMTETTDGFRLSSFDLQLRGPGDFFGKKQSGVPAFKLADMIHDYRTLAAARDDASRLVLNPHFWKDESFAQLRRPLIDSGILEHTFLD
ncbi:ATP-dependent DNA helicase RecG [Sporolactobacillus shoreae]|uniref:ATP-dependent DNA helicase RecG n=1 Tax=Sporolactobacillus shoreae TaxID=1465501 RepID=A0A4Z0GU53_9BACL|nr:ATP-dependent DNA helicase RecG [Sporolactobacillus shoreae]TGB00248.1 ATP-dependent DNA helicase RecG [Sporolactobacillus shoreae]